MADEQQAGKPRGKAEGTPTAPSTPEQDEERRYTLLELENASRVMFGVSIHEIRGALSLSPRKTHSEAQVHELLAEFATRTPT